MISVRAGDIILALDVPPRMSARNVLEAIVEEVHEVGPRVLVYVDVGVRLVAEITPNALAELEIRKGMDVYLILKHNDPCPNTVIEGMACGLPVLYSASGGVPELVGSEAGIGLACDEDWERPRWPDAAAIADGVLAIVERRAAYAAAARRRAVDRFDLVARIVRHREVFIELLEDRS